MEHGALNAAHKGRMWMKKDAVEESHTEKHLPTQNASFFDGD